MKAIISYENKNYEIDLYDPLDISIPIRGGSENVNAWYVGQPEFIPHRDGEYVGDISKGASTNFYDIRFNPHAHGTHTECVGHITIEHQSVNGQLLQFFFLATLITIDPIEKDGDFLITMNQVKNAIGNSAPKALIIRTLPNGPDKRGRQYSHTNPPYMSEGAMDFIRLSGVEHLLVDLPSVDKEKDNGELLAHKSFWDVKGKIRPNATITEFIFVEDSVLDGDYFLNLQVAPFENDASPSRPVLYKIKQL